MRPDPAALSEGGGVTRGNARAAAAGEAAGAEVPDSLAARVRRARTGKGWSCRALAARAGVSVMSVSRAENGCAVLVGTAAALAGALGVSLDWLAGLEDQEQQRRQGSAI